MDNTVRVGSLCSGYGGLELSLGLIDLDVQLEWYAEIDKYQSKIMEFHHPEVTNYGDLKKMKNVPHVDLVLAGFPCQPVSQAGHKKGIEDERWIIDDVCKIWRESGAQWLLLENVPGLFSASDGEAFGRVADSLTKVGAIARWTSLRASDIGASHGRERWFCIAQATPDTYDIGGVRLSSLRSYDYPQSWRNINGRISERFGGYAEAVIRWEDCFNELAPIHHIDKRVSPLFVEWMMGLPKGHVTNPGIKLSYTRRLKALGDGVIPQQAAIAFYYLFQEFNNDQEQV